MARDFSARELRQLERASQKLDQLQKLYADKPIAEFANFIKRDVFSVDSNESNAVTRRILERFARLSVEAIEDRERPQATVGRHKQRPQKRPPPSRYRTSIFKCLEDYDSCCKEHHRHICTAMVIVCITRQLIPFIPKE
jgi:hypothetical protein